MTPAQQVNALHQVAAVFGLKVKKAKKKKKT